MNKLNLLLLTILIIPIFGCSHHLEVKNINDYQSSTLTTLSKDLSVGVVTSNDNKNGQILVTGAATSLSNYVGKIIYPYSQNNSQQVDVISKITVKSDHKGSVANFFINFPGFLVWTSAWNGYVYKPSYDIDVEMVNASDQSIIDSFSIPIRLDVRHSSIDRTWTQITWLEAGIIGLIGGVVFIQYDDDVTHLVENEVKKIIGDYLAQEIATRLGNTSAYKTIINQKNQVRLMPPSPPLL